MSDQLDPEGEEAILRYRKLAKAEEIEPQSVPRIPGFGESRAVPATVGAGVVSFSDQELRADGRPQDVYDPWGIEDGDEYPAPGALTAREDEKQRRQRRGGSAMAVRGSGTRGGRGAGGGAGPAPMVGTTGVSGGGAAAPITGPSTAGSLPAPGLLQAQGAVQQSALQTSGSTSGLLASAQTSSRAVSGAAFSPPVGVGVQAAGADDTSYDPDLIRRALEQNGFGHDAAGVSSGVPSPGGQAGGSIVGTGSSGFPGTDVAGGRGNGAWPVTGGDQSGGDHSSSGGSGAGSFQRDPGSHPGSGSWGDVGQGGGGGSSVGPGGVSASQSGPQTTGGSSSSGRQSSSGPAPAYSPSGAATYGYDVATGDLRRDSRQWSDVSAMSAPIGTVILSTPEPTSMFGHITTPIPAYKLAVTNSTEFVEQSSGQHGLMADHLARTALNFDLQEETAVALTKGMNE